MGRISLMARPCPGGSKPGFQCLSRLSSPAPPRRWLCRRTAPSGGRAVGSHPYPLLPARPGDPGGFLAPSSDTYFRVRGCAEMPTKSSAAEITVQVKKAHCRQRRFRTRKSYCAPGRQCEPVGLCREAPKAPTWRQRLLAPRSAITPLAYPARSEFPRPPPPPAAPTERHTKQTGGLKEPASWPQRGRKGPRQRRSRLINGRAVG